MRILNYDFFNVAHFLCISFLGLEGTYWNMSFGPLFLLATPLPNPYHQLIKLSAENRQIFCV